MSDVHSHKKIIICGAGPVGQACALLLHQAGFAASEVLLIDAKTSEQAQQDARSIALSYGSAQILKQLKATPRLSTAIAEIHVSRRRHFGRSMIMASDYQLPALGYVARYGDIVAPLEAALQQAGIVTQRPLRVMNITEHGTGASVTVQDHHHTEHALNADIVIQAEGGTFADQDQRSQHHDYQQTAIIAHVTVSHPIAQRAFERFTEQGPLALLPQEAGYALVWCVDPDRVSALMQTSDAAFLEQLQQAFGDRLGQFQTCSPRAAFPLGLNAQSETLTHAEPRAIRIGNAAQTLHPVAGQGLNLGLRDAFVLARCLARDCSPAALHEFVASRKTDRTTTIKLTDTLAKLFTHGKDGSPLQNLFSLQLGLLDLLPPAKKMLAQQMMFGWRT